MAVNGDQAVRVPTSLIAAEALAHPRRAQPEPVAGHGFRHHQLAVSGAEGIGLGDRDLAARAAAGERDPAAGAGPAIDAEDLARRRAEKAYRPRLVKIVFDAAQAREHALAYFGGPAAPARRDDDARRRRIALPADRPGVDPALNIGLDNLYDHYSRRGGTAPGPRSVFVEYRLHQFLEGGAVGGGDAERAGQRPLARRTRTLGDETADLLLGRERARSGFAAAQGVPVRS